jgi:hypothetical protein
MKVKEVWKDIPGYEGFYQVSNHGRVQSLDRLRICNGGGTVGIKGVILRPTFGGRGNGRYFQVRLRRNTPRRVPHKAFYVAVLVARLFVPNPKNKPEVNHKDLDKLNNYFENLEWMTRSEQQTHARLHGRGARQSIIDGRFLPNTF